MSHKQGKLRRPKRASNYRPRNPISGAARNSKVHLEVARDRGKELLELGPEMHSKDACVSFY